MKSRIFIAVLLIIIMISGTSYAQDIILSDMGLDASATTDNNIEHNTQATENTNEDVNPSNTDDSDIQNSEDDIINEKSFLDEDLKKRLVLRENNFLPTRNEFVVLTNMATDMMSDWKHFYRDYYTRSTALWLQQEFIEGNIEKTERQHIADSFVKIYDYAVANEKQIDRKEYQEHQSKITNTTTEYYISLGINHDFRGTSIPEDFVGDEIAFAKFSLQNNYCQFTLMFEKFSTSMEENGFTGNVILTYCDYYYIKNPKEFMDYVLSMADVLGMEVNDETEYEIDYKDFDYEAQTYAGETYKVIDRVSFEADIDDSFYDTYIEEVASPNSTISCVIELIRSGTSNFLLFNMKGDRGEKLYWDVPYYRWESNWIMFNIKYHEQDGNLVTASKPPNFYTKIEGVTDEDGKIDLTLTVHLWPIGNLPTKIVSKNLKYESFIDEDTSIWDKNRNLGGLFSLTREKMAEENEKIKEQLSQEIDYENYVNYLRKKDEDGNVISDYFVHFIAQVELSIKSNILPDWYNKLGDNVTATIIGITKIIRNNERVDSMILFKGDKGEKWFTNSSIIPSSAMTMMKYTSDEDLSINCTYSELKSFDGEKTVRNTIEYEQMSFEFKYKNDGYLTPDGIDFKIGPKSQHFDEQDIKYIGGGKLSYANLW